MQAEVISIDPGSRCGTEPEIEFMFSINGILDRIEQEKEEGIRNSSRAIQQYNAGWAPGMHSCVFSWSEQLPLSSCCRKLYSKYEV